jgi:molybdopterin-containing oxidoreductase family iron-sulfur binding subunit
VGIRILTETVSSPTLADQIRALQKLYPSAKWHQWEPAGAHEARAGAMQAFGQAVNTYYNLANAAVVVALDSDFLACGPPRFALCAAVRGAAGVRAAGR